MKYLFFLIIGSLLFISCEKGVTFDLEESSPKLVVEATIETSQPPVVILSKSQNFFDQITPDILAARFVRNADVYVSNGVKTHRLREYTVPDANVNTFFIYSMYSSDLSTAFAGEPNTAYSLRIIADGKEYTASTKIPTITRRIDSLYQKQA